MRAVGYRQAWSYLNDEQSEPAFIEAGVAASRQLAKRQITWLRSFQDLHRLDPSAISSAALEQRALQWWQAGD